MIKPMLENLIKHDRLPHAILIEGDDDKENIKLAKEIASLVVCNGTYNKNSCLNKIKKDIHPDVKLIKGDGKQNNFNIDKIREIRLDAHIMPNESSAKIYILKNTENMTIGAQNAILKILEDPPEYVVIIFLCNNSNLLLSTVLSRLYKIKLSNEHNNLQKESKSNIIALQIVDSLIENGSWGFLINSNKINSNKNLFTDVIKDLKKIFINMLKYKKSGEYDTEKEGYIIKYSNYFNCSKIFSIINMLNECEQMLKYNVNLNILTTWLNCEIEKTISK